MYVFFAAIITGTKIACVIINASYSVQANKSEGTLIWMNIIAADVGGTKTRLIWVNTDQPQKLLYECQYNSYDYSDIVALLDTFISDSGFARESLDGLALALPGSVDGEDVQLTNLPWVVSRLTLEREFDVSNVLLINDFQASSWGALSLEQSALVILNQGSGVDNGGLSVTVGAGTGLGLSWMLNGKVYATEAGHIDFAPTSPRQLELLNSMMQTRQHVSYERLLSGAGLITLYEFCSGNLSSQHDPAWVTSELNKNNAAAIEAVSLFVDIYGAYIGNIALLFRPDNGIYITGGIAPKLIKWMQSSAFLESYYNKGRMRTLVEQTRVFVVTDERVGALGVLSLALKNFQDTGYEDQ